MGDEAAVLPGDDLRHAAQRSVLELFVHPGRGQPTKARDVADKQGRHDLPRLRDHRRLRGRLSRRLRRGTRGRLCCRVSILPGDRRRAHP